MNFFFGKKAEEQPKKERFAEPARNTQGEQYSYSPRDPSQQIIPRPPPTTTTLTTQGSKQVRFENKPTLKPFNLP